jgi:hypothetical protein
MKTSVFEKLIRKVIREEIDYALRREIKTLKEDLRDEFKSTIVEQPTQRNITANGMGNPIPTSVKSSLKEKIIGKKPISQQFTSNGALNDLLNETAQGDTNLESLSPSEPSIPAEIENIVNRDYRELMRAMDKRKTHRP